MVLVERSGETIRNGKRSRGPSPNGRGTPETSSDDDSTKKVSGRSTKSKEYDEKIRVGRDYQAVCPEFIPPTDRKGELNERALLVWAPTKDIADDRLDEYIEVAKDKFGYNGEQALGMLFWHKHDLERAVLDLANFTPFPDEWSVEDRVLFEQAFQFHGKSFHRIRQMLPDKSIASLVKYYYSWKKSRAHTSAMDRPEKEHSNGSNADDESEEDDSRKWPLHRGIRRASGSSPSRGFIDDHTVHPTNQANAGQVANGINVVQTEVGTTGMATTSTANNQNQNPNGTSATTNQNHNEISMAGVPLLNCTGCGVNCHKINVFPLGKLCNSCNHHWRRTGVLRPTSGPSYLGGTKRRTGGNNANISAGGNGGSGTTFNTNVSGKHKRKPPRGMYINHDDIVELAGSDINETKSIELLASMDREVISLLTQIQQNKQNISTLKRKLARNIPELRPYDNSNRINSRWSNEELLIAVEGVKEYGKNFEAIAEAIGTKTEAQVRTFFVNYRRRYNLDNMLKEYEMKHSQRQRAPLNGGNRSNDGSSGDEENLQIVIDEDASSGNDRPNNREHNITVTSTTGIIHGQANSTNNSTAIVIDGIDGDDDVIITKESPPPGINGILC